MWKARKDRPIEENARAFPAANKHVLNGISEIESMGARHIHCTGAHGSTRFADRSMRLRPGFAVRATLKRATCSFISEQGG
jgi:hypothetical protein